MRILWVEDFGGIDEDGFVEFIFEGLLPSKMLEALAALQGRESSGVRPDKFYKWREWYTNNGSLAGEYEIDVIRTFEQFEAVIKSGFASDRYDVALLDVNLENESFGFKGIKAEEGGFLCWNKLVKAEFPPSRIALLTAHNGEKHVDEFKTMCSNNSHEELEGFSKSRNDVVAWIKKLSVENDAFLYYRRGVLDGLDFVENQLGQCHPESILFNKYSSTIQGEQSNLLSVDGAKDYIVELKHALSKRLIPSESEAQYKRFLAALTDKWESRPFPKKYIDDSKIEKNYLPGALYWVMKNARNWTAHGNFKNSIATADLAFLFLINMRAMFGLANDSEELHRYEHWLMLVPSGRPSIAFDGRGDYLAKSYISAYKRLPDDYRRGQNFSFICKELTGDNNFPVDFDLMKALRDMFQHLLVAPHYEKNRDLGREELAKRYRENLKNTPMPNWVMKMLEWLT